MHPHFAEWYRLLLVQPDDKLLESRWELVEQTAKDMSLPLAMELVRVSFGLPVQDDGAISPLKQKLKSAELSYARATTHLELALIGDCAMLEVLTSNLANRLSAQELLACALACQQCIRTTLSRPVQKELLATARSVLGRSSIKRRRSASITGQQVNLDDIKSPKSSLQVGQETVTTSYQDRNGYQISISIQVPNLEEINTGFKNIVRWQKSLSESVSDQLRTLLNAVQQQSKDVASALVAPQEEANIQWYLLGETSRELYRPFSSFEMAELIPVAAVELADLTTVLPGPYAALAYLDRILTQARSPEAAEQVVSLAAIMDAVQPLWKKASVTVSSFDGVQDLTPVLCALSCATAGRHDWITIVPQLCQVPIDMQLPARLLSYQLYQEILFARLAHEHFAPKRAL